MNARQAIGVFAEDNITHRLDLLKVHRKTVVLHRNYLGLYIHLLVVVGCGDRCGLTLLISPVWQTLYDSCFLYLS